MWVATGQTREDALRAVEGLASGAAHHLNDLLAVVIAHLQLALGKADSPDLRRHLAVAERAAQEGAEVIRQLSRFGSACLAPRSEVDLNRLAAEVVEATRARWSGSGIRIDARLHADPIPPVSGDAGLLREAIENLVVNAIDAMPRGGSLTIRTSVTGDAVLCSVTDSGEGMAADVQRQALDPFFTTKGLKSTGLGLSVSHGIVRGHGGEVTIASAEGQGTTVTLRLPLAPAAPAAVPAGAAASA